MEKYLQKFEDYLRGNLKEQEQRQFEKSLEEDPEMKREFEIFQDITGGIKQKANKELGAHLDTIYREVRGKPTPSSFWSKWWWLIAIAVVLLITVLIFFLRNRSQPDLYAQYFIPFSTELSTRGSASTSPEVIQLQLDAQKALESGAYDQFLSLIKQHPSVFDPSNQPQLHLSIGIAQLEQGQFEEALRSFSALENHSILQHQAIYYKALVYLKVEQTASALQVLKAHQWNDGLIGKKAKALINAIEKLGNAKE